MIQSSGERPMESSTLVNMRSIAVSLGWSFSGIHVLDNQKGLRGLAIAAARCGPCPGLSTLRHVCVLNAGLHCMLTVTAAANDAEQLQTR